MSLKKFHLLFITLSVGLCLFFGVWCIRVYRVQDGGSYAALAVLSLVGALGLVVYEVWFLRKMREVNGS